MLTPFDIFWNDLTEKTKEDIKEALGYDPAREHNWDIFPIATIYAEVKKDEES